MAHENNRSASPNPEHDRLRYWSWGGAGLIWAAGGMLALFFAARPMTAGLQAGMWALYFVVLTLLLAAAGSRRHGLRNAVVTALLAFLAVYPGGSIAYPLYVLQQEGRTTSAVVRSVRHEESAGNQTLDSWYYSFTHPDGTQVPGPELELHHSRLKVGTTLRIVEHPRGSVAPALPEELQNTAKLLIPWSGAVLVAGGGAYQLWRGRRAQLLARHRSTPGTPEHARHRQTAHTQEQSFRSRIRGEIRGSKWSGIFQVRADRYAAMGYRRAEEIAEQFGLEPAVPKNHKRAYWTFRNPKDLGISPTEPATSHGSSPTLD